MAGLLEGKVAVITGAGRGIGRACARVFVREGARVAAVDISGAEKETAVELGEAVVPVHADVSQEDQVAAMVETVVETFGRLDVLVNNAAAVTGRTANAGYLNAEDYDQQIAVTLHGVF